MAKQRITLTFPTNKITEPVVFTMAKECDVIPNIRRARVTETVGEMTLELEGAESDIQSAVAYLRDKGVQVESADGSTTV